MARRRGRRSMARKRRQARHAGLTSAGATLLLLVVFWSVIWVYVVGLLVLGGLSGLGWWLWRTDRLARGRDRAWREAEAVRAGRRTLTEIDAMSGTEFEHLVAALCRRDGCTDVRRVGGAYDDGVDVVGRLPDGRTLVVQCKRYAPSNAISSREVRDLLGARVHSGAEVAIFVTTSRFTHRAAAFAVTNDILAVHRDLLGRWNAGTSLLSLSSLNGFGQGDSRHRARWKQTYGR